MSAVPTIGYHASHEQFTPSALLEFVQRAASAGFDAAMCSDHFHPWSEEQGESGFAWSWLGAALQATDLPFGVVCAPGYRYHPAIIAQAAATLAEMYPGRFWLAAGSGERLNEHITGEVWPPKPERNERLRDCVDVMRALWAGDTVTHRGLVQVEEARLYTRPAAPPRVFGAALTEQTAEWTGSWADGLITVSAPPDKLKRLTDAFRRGGGDGKPIVLQIKLSYANTDADALAGAHQQWRSVVFDSAVLAELRMPAEFDAAARLVRQEEMHAFVHVSSDVERHVEWIRGYGDFGFEALYLHNVHSDQQRFIDDFGEHVLPALRDN
ncbi:MAG TPA: TIGR03885 family FMN-dependent LLM class oxidoreductase [Longimicrobiales bacterium]|nr:TIGR03885 family FMN-dependent LLM class oxidoreductase [Longimicrobiales bacterium]